jgi:hypothetical protein
MRAVANPTTGQDLEALQARLRTLQAEIAAEHQHAAAAEAVVAASRAAVSEAGLARVGSPPRPRRLQRWVLGLGAGLVLVASLLVGLGLRQTRVAEELAAESAALEAQRSEAQRELIALERRLSQARLTTRPCPTGQYGQAGDNPEGSRSATTPPPVR